MVMGWKESYEMLNASPCFIVSAQEGDHMAGPKLRQTLEQNSLSHP